MSFQLSSLPNKQPEYVYLIENELGLVKIGISTNPAKRFKSISLNSGLMIEKQHLSPLCFNARAIEQQMHAQFVAYRVKGEWFKGIDFDTLKSALDGYFNNFVVTVESQRDNSPFEFDFNGCSLRTIKDDSGVVWFVAKDVCEALELDNTSKVISRLDDDEKLVSLLVISGQKREILCINESGLYTLILRSNKPQAKPFRKWVTSEVLPAIRKTGGYGVNGELATQVYELQRQVTALQNEIGFITNLKVVREARNKAYQLATPSKSEAENAIEEFVSEYIETHSSQAFFTITEILSALGIPKSERKQSQRNQIGAILRNLGFESTQLPPVNGIRKRVYAKPARLAVRKPFNSLTPVKGV